MNQQENMEKKLWEYIDGLSTADERSAVEKLLQSNREWENKLDELRYVQQMMQSSELDQPSLRFTKNVMEEIAKLHIAPATKNYINKKIIWGIAWFFITLILGFLIYGFGQIDWTAKGDTRLPIDFSQVDYNKIFNNNFVNAFMMLNVLLGLVLLDRVLAGKRKKFYKKA
jgi:hypothetical protein